jgi:hypothetical protein
MLRYPRAVASVGRIHVVEPGDSANRLLECLRVRAAKYGVGIEAGEAGGDRLMVSDPGARIDNLWDFLEAQLDDCADELKLEWERLLRVPGPGPRGPVLE